MMTQQCGKGGGLHIISTQADGSWGPPGLIVVVVVKLLSTAILRSTEDYSVLHSLYHSASKYHPSHPLFDRLK